MTLKKHILGLALAMALVGCTTDGSAPPIIGDSTNPASQRARLDTIVSNLDAAKSISWARYQSALLENKSALTDVAKTCAAPVGLTNNELIASCYAVSAQAYALLADHPYDASAEDENPVLAAAAVGERASEPCGTLPGSAACDAIDLSVSTALGRAASAAIKAAELGSGDIDADAVAGNFNILEQDIATNWGALLAPRGDGEQAEDARKTRYAVASAIACNAIQSGPVLQGRAEAGPPAVKISNASAAMAKAAGLALRPSLCEGANQSCTLNTECQVDEPSDTCAARYTLALKTSCGAG